MLIKLGKLVTDFTHISHGQKFVANFSYITHGFHTIYVCKYQCDNSVGNICVNTHGFLTKILFICLCMQHILTLMSMSSYVFVVSYYKCLFINVTIYANITSVCKTLGMTYLCNRPLHMYEYLHIYVSYVRLRPSLYL